MTKTFLNLKHLISQMMRKKRGLKNKKGVSAIVATLIIVLLVIVAAGIIWVVIRNIVQSGAEQVEFGQKCLEVNLEYVSVAESADAECGEDDTGYDVTLRRTAGGDEIAGVKISLLSSTESSELQDFGVIGELETKTAEICVEVDDADKIEFTAYFEDSAGNPVYCQTNEREFS
jgi:flagellin-like protein